VVNRKLQIFKDQNLSDPDPLAEFDIGRRLDRPLHLRRNGLAPVHFSTAHNG
jgi:hypothetical protein